MTPEGAEEAPTFIKGNLTHVGTRELVSRFDHFGLRVGPRIIDKDLYAGVDPGFAYHASAVALSLHVPLNLLVFQGGSREFAGGEIRRQDWDEISDFAKIVRFITYGRKESTVYFTITSLRPYSLGHGQLIHNYQPSIDVDRTLTGAVFEAYNRWGGFQAQINDVTLQNQVVGALAFVKPLGFVDNSILSSLSFGLEYAADFSAPQCIQVSENDRRCVPGTGNAAGFDPQSGQTRDDTFVRTDPDLGRPYIDEESVQALGISAEIKVVKTEGTDLKLYGTAHQFIGAGAGFAAGFLGRFNDYGARTQAIRLRGELRSFANNFQPAYFDTLYEVTKYQVINQGSNYQVAPTKSQWVFGDDDNGFALSDDGQHVGYNLEFSWGQFANGRAGKEIAAAVGLAESTRDDDTNFYVHFELPLLRLIQLFGTFMRINAPNIGSVFTSSLDNVVMFAGLRVQILPFLFVNANYSRMYRIVRGPGREFHLGNQNVVDDNGRPSPFFTNDRIFENVDSLFVDLEFGWEFRD